jgi:hypothetical protein
MAALLTSDAPTVQVVSDGSVVGSVTLDSIRAALRHDDAGQTAEAEAEEWR